MRLSEMRSRYRFSISAVEMRELSGAVADHAFHARTFDDAGQDGVDADVGGAELFGEALREADNAEFRRGIGGAESIAVPPGGRRHVDDRAAGRRLEQRHGAPRAQELPGEADFDAAAPFGGIDVLDAAGRPGDACIVHERVEAAELRLATP